MDIVLDQKILWSVCGEVLSKVVASNMGYVNYSRLKLFLDFENTEAAKAFNKTFKDSTGVVVHH